MSIQSTYKYILVSLPWSNSHHRCKKCTAYIRCNTNLFFNTVCPVFLKADRISFSCLGCRVQLLTQRSHSDRTGAMQHWHKAVFETIGLACSQCFSVTHTFIVLGKACLHGCFPLSSGRSHMILDSILNQCNFLMVPKIESLFFFFATNRAAAFCT